MEVEVWGGPRLRSDAPSETAAWVSAFLLAIADEAADALQLLGDLERAWFAARRAAAAVDLLAATPLLSATTLAAGLGMAINNAAGLLEQFCASGVAVRSKRRLFGLADLAPLRDEVAAPAAAGTRARPAAQPAARDGSRAAMAFAEQRIRAARRSLKPQDGIGSPGHSKA